MIGTIWRYRRLTLLWIISVVILLAIQFSWHAKELNRRTNILNTLRADQAKPINTAQRKPELKSTRENTKIIQKSRTAMTLVQEARENANNNAATTTTTGVSSQTRVPPEYSKLKRISNIPTKNFHSIRRQKFAPKQLVRAGSVYTLNQNTLKTQQTDSDDYLGLPGSRRTGFAEKIANSGTEALPNQRKFVENAYFRQNLQDFDLTKSVDKFCFNQLIVTYKHESEKPLYCTKSHSSKHMDLCVARNARIFNGKLTLGKNVEFGSKNLLYDLQNIKMDENLNKKLLNISENPISDYPPCKNRVKYGYFYEIDNVHIYFKTLGFYNVYEMLLKRNVTISEVSFFHRYAHVDLPNHFEDFEISLFGAKKESSANEICFDEIVFVPNAFASNPFRCKMGGGGDGEMVRNCKKCLGAKMPHYAVHSFKMFILRKCKTEEKSRTSFQITFILRKPYLRFGHDKIQNFQRVLLNSDQVLTKLETVAQKTNVKTVRNVSILAVSFEDKEYCEQVRLARNSDILIGVHGAGLVHLWWLRDEAEVIEVVPRSQLSNPSFETLARLTGRRYTTYTVPDRRHGHVVLGDHFVDFVSRKIWEAVNRRKSGDVFSNLESKNLEEHVVGKPPEEIEIKYDNTTFLYRDNADSKTKS